MPMISIKHLRLNEGIYAMHKPSRDYKSTKGQDLDMDEFSVSSKQWAKATNKICKFLC